MSLFPEPMDVLKSPSGAPAPLPSTHFATTQELRWIQIRIDALRHCVDHARPFCWICNAAAFTAPDGAVAPLPQTRRALVYELAWLEQRVPALTCHLDRLEQRERISQLARGRAGARLVL